MQNAIYKKITDLKIKGIEDVYLVVCFEKDNKNIWNKDFNFYLSSEARGRDEFNYFFTSNTFAKIWRIAMDNSEKAQDILARGGHFPLATIKNGKIKDLTKTI